MKLERFEEVKRLMEERERVMDRRETWLNRKYDSTPLLASLLAGYSSVPPNHNVPKIDEDNAMNEAILKAIQQEYENRLRRIEADLQAAGVELTPTFAAGKRVE